MRKLLLLYALLAAPLSAQTLDVTCKPCTVKVGDTLFGVLAVPRAVNGRISGNSTVTWSQRQTKGILNVRADASVPYGREAFVITYDTGRASVIGDWLHTTQNKHYTDTVQITVTPRTAAPPTQPPVTQPPVTQPPVTQPPVTPPTTPPTNPPTTPPSGGGVLAYQDFRKFTSTDNIKRFCTGPEIAGDFWAGPGLDGNCNTVIPTGADGWGVVFDPAEKAIRYDFGARPTCPQGPTACSRVVGLYARLNPLQVGTSNELWIKFTDKLSANFKPGGGGAVGSQIEYKYLFVDMPQAPNTTAGQFQVELEAGFGLRMKILDYKGNLASTSNPGQPLDYPLGAGFPGQWHTWVFGMIGFGTPQVTFIAYLDGVEVRRISGKWFPDASGNSARLSGSIVAGIQMGANINNGPDQAQHRWWQELGVYTTKPSLLPFQ